MPQIRQRLPHETTSTAGWVNSEDTHPVESGFQVLTVGSRWVDEDSSSGSDSLYREAMFFGYICKSDNARKLQTGLLLVWTVESLKVPNAYSRSPASS